MSGGRPRKHPEGTTSTDRVNLSLAALKEAGGDRKTFRLGPEAMRALKELKRARRKATETQIVEAALIAAMDQLNKRREEAAKGPTSSQS